MRCKCGSLYDSVSFHIIWLPSSFSLLNFPTSSALLLQAITAAVRCRQCMQRNAFTAWNIYSLALFYSLSYVVVSFYNNHNTIITTIIIINNYRYSIFFCCCICAAYFANFIRESVLRGRVELCRLEARVVRKHGMAVVYVEHYILLALKDAETTI